METSTFESSDSARHARQLKHARHVTFRQPLRLEMGGVLPEVTVVYETYGRLNANKDNAVLICHAISGDSHVARHNDEDDPGWWDIFVGPGKSVDTDRYFVICPNVLGGCRGTTGPNSINPATNKRYGADFPVITVRDMVEVQRWLVAHLGIDCLLAVLGGSLGGHMTLTWATRFPDELKGAVAMATSPRLTSQALAFDVVGRNAILRDPEYQAGQYHNNGPGPRAGLAIARMLGHITYLSPEVMTERFDATRLEPREVRSQFETKFSVGAYLAYQGDRFGERFDANSYLTLSMAIDQFDLGGTPEVLSDALGHSQCRWLVISFSSDWLYPSYQSREIVDSLIANDKPVSYCEIKTNCGHDAFLLPHDLDRYGELTRAFLGNLHRHLDGQEPAIADEDMDQSEDMDAVEDMDASEHGPASIFGVHHRLDYDMIVQLIPPDASVLDLGCGSGGLLSRLATRNRSRLMGVELDERAIVSCARRGPNVVQIDLNQGLSSFADVQFDFVVLSQTLQTVMDVQRVLDEMLRVGRRGIVSFPNLGYRRFRSQLVTEGRAPREDAAHQWYDTPSVRFLTIADFEQFCRDKRLKIHDRIFLDAEQNRRVEDDPNLNADIAILVLSK